MKITKLPYYNPYNASLPSPNFQNINGDIPPRNNARRKVDEVYLEPIAVIENPFTQKILKTDFHEKGNLVDLYA
jgi:hypothetical protein